MEKLMDQDGDAFREFCDLHCTKQSLDDSTSDPASFQSPPPNQTQSTAATPDATPKGGLAEADASPLRSAAAPRFAGNKTWGAGAQPPSTITGVAPWATKPEAAKAATDPFAGSSMGAFDEDDDEGDEEEDEGSAPFPESIPNIVSPAGNKPAAADGSGDDTGGTDADTDTDTDAFMAKKQKMTEGEGEGGGDEGDGESGLAHVTTFMAKYKTVTVTHHFANPMTVTPTLLPDLKFHQLVYGRLIMLPPSLSFATGAAATAAAPC